jgi:hypothetical protein
VPTITNNIEIDKGKTLTVGTGQRCKVQGSLEGEGTMKISYPYVRGDFGIDLKNFQGTLEVTSGEFHITKAMDLSNGTFQLDGGVFAAGFTSQSSTQTSMTHKIGVLKSTVTDCTIGTGIWNVGYLGTDFTYAGSFNNAATLNKYGEGVLTLTGSSSANMNVNEGVLCLNNTTSTTTGLVKANKGGKVQGTGKTASVTVANGGMVGAGKPNSILTGTLTLTGNLTVQNGGIIIVKGTGATSVDKFNVAGKVILTNPIFQMERISGEWESDTDYKVFSGTGAITITGEPTILPETPRAGYLWDLSSLKSDGIIRIVPDPVGINEIMADPSKHVIYDMAGRRVNNIDRHGVYIVDGRKVTVK